MVADILQVSRPRRTAILFVIVVAGIVDACSTGSHTATSTTRAASTGQVDGTASAQGTTPPGTTLAPRCSPNCRTSGPGVPSWQWNGGGSLSLTGVADMPFGSDEDVVVSRMRAALGEPSHYEVYEPRESGEGGCYRTHTSILSYGNLSLNFFERRLGLWTLSGAWYADHDGSVAGLAPSFSASLGEHRPDIAAAMAADTEDVFHFFGQEVARAGDVVAKVQTDENGVVVRIAAISLPIGDCVLMD